MNARYRAKQGILIAGDVLFLFLGMIVALYVRRLGTIGATELSNSIVWFSLLILVWTVVHYINGLYEIGRHKKPGALYPRIIQAAIANLLLGVVFFYFVPQQIISPKTILLMTIVFGYSFVSLWRWLFGSFFSTTTFLSNVLFIGDTPEMRELAQIIRDRPEHGYALMAWISPKTTLDKHLNPNTACYDSIKAIRPAVSVHSIDTVVIAQGVKEDSEVLKELYELLFWRVKIISLTSLYETLTGRIPPHTFSESWFLDHLQHSSNGVHAHIRRLLDIFAGIILFILFLVLYPFVALAIRVTSSGSVLFCQERVGTSGTIFFLYKFRSMYVLADDGSAETDGVQFAKKNDTRITRIGKFLRKSRLDELPQAINLLRGELSIIGPRPERPEIVQNLEAAMPYYPVRHITKPGLTGWAQVNQHYTDTLEQSLQKLQYDLYYIKNRSFLLDLSILLKTVNVVLRGMGQ